MKLSRRKKILLEKIKRAFDDTQYPGDSNIGYSANDYDSYLMMSWLKGKHWKDLDLKSILERGSSLSFLTDEAYRFYLPAWLVASLEDSPDRAYESLLYTLWPPFFNAEDKEKFLNRVSGFNKKQKEAIALFLADAALDEYEVKDIQPFAENTPEQALINYWNQFI